MTGLLVLVVIFFSFLSSIFGYLFYSFYKKNQTSQQEKEELRDKNNKLVIEDQKNKSKIESLEKSMPNQFKTLAQEILDEKGKKYQEVASKKQEDAKKEIELLLSPLKEKIKTFNETFLSQTSKTNVLHGDLKGLIKSLEMDTKNLTKALKGDQKTQGNWGEMILKNILESMGLEEGRDFISQAKDLKLVDQTSQKRLIPDFIINLNLNPKKQVIIDSKVSLSSYERFLKAETEEEKQKHLDDLVKSLNQHVDSLSSKDYKRAKGLESLEFTMMFIPIEGVLQLVSTKDPKLFERAWRESVAIVSPLSLYPALRVVYNTWQIHIQNKNARKIAEESGKLYDKFIGFLTNFEKIKSSLSRVNESYDEALKQLKSGRGNLISRAEEIKKLGAKTDKKLPDELEYDPLLRPSKEEVLKIENKPS